MSAASVVHLLAAQESVIERHRYRTYPSVCGEVISAVNLPPDVTMRSSTAWDVYTPLSSATCVDRR
jgi:hypothetical protein